MFRGSHFFGARRAVFAVLLCAVGFSTSLSRPKQSANTTQSFSKDGLAFTYPAGWALRDESAQPAQVITLVGGTSSLGIISPRAPVKSPDELVTARQKYVDPPITDLVRLTEAAGGRIERTPVVTEIGGSRAEGVRLRVTLGETTELYEFYWLELNGRVLLANLIAPERDSAQALAAWDVLRRSLTITLCADAPGHEQILALYRHVYALTGRERSDERIGLLECVAKALDQTLVEPEYREPVIRVYNDLGQLYMQKENYGKAETAYRRGLQILEQSGPEGQVYLASLLTHLGQVFESRAEYAQAEPLLKRALQVIERETPPAPDRVALGLGNLAQLYYRQGRYVEAEALYLRSIESIEKLPADERVKHGHVYATSLFLLAQLYSWRGDYRGAEPLFKRAIALGDPSTGPKHQYLSYFLSDLALLYYQTGRYDAARPLLDRSLEMKVSIFGPVHRETATTLSLLAAFYRDGKAYDEALRLDMKALEIRERVLPAGHPDIGLSLHSIGFLHFNKGDYTGAEAYQMRALGLFEKTLGPNHPYVVDALLNLSLTFEAKGEARLSIEYMARGLELAETHLALIMTAGSEAQKLAYIGGRLTGQVDRVVSLDVNFRGQEPRATRLALTTVLRRKGRVLDSLADIFGSMRKRLPPEVAPLLDELASVRTQLATLVFKGPGGTDLQQYRAALLQLEAAQQRLEAAVSARSERYRSQTQRVTLEAVQLAIPADAALVEFVLYYPLDAQAQPGARLREPRYAAYVLRRAGDPVLVPLGEAATTDGKVLQLRARMRRPGHAGKELARALYGELMAPVRDVLGDVRNVFISTDGSLNFLPFGALVGEDGRYLIEDYSFTYLTSGRDLLRLQTPSAGGRAPAAVAAPRFDGVVTEPSRAHLVAPGSTLADEVGDFGTLTFPDLPDSVREAAAIKRYLPATVMLTDSKATESAVRELEGPLVLHFATHGFFLPDQAYGAARRVTPNPAINLLHASYVPGGNPLLRSGLWLAGANRRAGGGADDGVLTALEVSSLNLDGMELVVLSACETGIGDVQNGEGVYGLRRALFTAGARSVVASLWQVNADATTEIMTKYYDHLLRRRAGRTAALRQAQLEMLKGEGTSQDYSSPYFWAGFIPLGDWKSFGLPTP